MAAWIAAGITLAILAFLAWFTIRFAWWRAAVSPSLPRVLMYHMVRGPLAGGRFNKMRVSPEAFRAQVRWLSENGWRFAFLSEIIHAPALEKTVVLTFDDGYRDNFLNALPVLREFGAKATLFPVIKRDAGYDWSASKKASHTGGELGREEKLSDAEIREMLATGLIELGGHTLSHANLPALPDAQAREEITGCKRALEETFGITVPTFCYPFGLFGKREAMFAREAGFIAAVTTEQGVSWSDPMEIPRVKISGTEGMFAFKLRMRTGKRN